MYIVHLTSLRLNYVLYIFFVQTFISPKNLNTMYLYYPIKKQSKNFHIFFLNIFFECSIILAEEEMHRINYFHAAALQVNHKLDYDKLFLRLKPTQPFQNHPFRTFFRDTEMDVGSSHGDYESDFEKINRTCKFLDRFSDKHQNKVLLCISDFILNLYINLKIFS